MAKRGLNIYKRKDGRWEGRYVKGRADNKIKYGYVYGGTFGEVRKVLLDKLNRAEGRARAEKICGEHPTFEAAAEGWLNELRPELKESSIVRYKNILTLYIKPCFGKLKLDDITVEKIKEFCGEMLIGGGVKGRGLSPKTVACILSVLKSIFKYAAKNGFVGAPDFCGIIIRQKQKPMKTLSLSEQNRLNKYLCENKNTINAGILVCLYTGLRIGEICALRWENIFLNEQIHIHKSNRAETPADRRQSQNQADYFRAEKLLLRENGAHTRQSLRHSKGNKAERRLLFAVGQRKNR